jgi:hypothetical protein
MAVTIPMMFFWKNIIRVSQLVKKLRILWNSKDHYIVHTSQPLVPTLSQMNPVHTLPPCCLTIHFNIILPSTPGLPSVLFPLSSAPWWCKQSVHLRRRSDYMVLHTRRRAAIFILVAVRTSDHNHKLTQKNSINLVLYPERFNDIGLGTWG